MNAVFAAPASGLPFLPTALVSHVVAAVCVVPPSHFFMNEDFAAPVSGLPLLLTACASQFDEPDGPAAGAAGFVLGAVAGA